MTDKLNHYLHHWYLTDPVLLAQTPTSMVYTTSEERVRHISQVLAEGMGISVDRLRAFVFAHACLACVWDNVPASDPDDPVLKIARITERYVKLEP